MVRTRTGQRKKEVRTKRAGETPPPRRSRRAAANRPPATPAEPERARSEHGIPDPEPIPSETGESRPAAQADRPPAVATETQAASRTLPASTSEEERTGAAVETEEEIQEWLAFRLGDEEYAVELLKVREIIRPVAITRVPRAPRLIQGIISLRGTVLPVFDLRLRLALKEVPAGRKTRIVVIHLKRGASAFIVDEVTEVARMRLGEIEPPPPTLAGAEATHLRGIGRVGGRMTILLDIERAVPIG
jgi:purine-binding chemotaxis protein CheW